MVGHAALAVVLFALSPLSVTLQREIFLDNFAVVWMLAAFTLAYSPRRHLWHHVAAGLCAAFAVLSKETMIIAIPALMVALWQNASRATRKYSFVGFLAAVMLVLIQYPLYAVLKGELFEGNGHVSLIGGLVYQMSRPGSGSIFAVKSSSYAVFHAWLYYDSVLIVGGVVATLIALAFESFSRRRARAERSPIMSAPTSRPCSSASLRYAMVPVPRGMSTRCSRPSARSMRPSRAKSRSKRRVAK